MFMKATVKGSTILLISAAPAARPSTVKGPAAEVVDEH
jgi:hypothetical protein